MTAYPFPVPAGSPFLIANIPFGIFSTDEQTTPRPGVAVGDHILDLQQMIEHGFGVDDEVQAALFSTSLNALAALPAVSYLTLRKSIQTVLANPKLLLYKEWENRSAKKMVIRRDEATMHLPMQIGGFTDFMCSLEHLQKMGQIGGNPKVADSFFNIPLAYNGRASSVRLGDEGVSRPWGAVPATDGATYSPCQKFDYEVEMGIFLSKPIPYGQSVPAAKAKDHVFGLVLLNDWSARDVQFYEMTPLGPFNGKATATSISPWIVTMAALEEAGAVLRTETADAGGKSTPIPFLACSDDLSIRVSSYISRNGEYQRDALAQTDLQHLHWSPFQMLAHHSSSGCGMDTGDLVGTGTLSSSESQLATAEGWCEGVRGSGCLYELTCAGSKPFRLTDGSELKWLEDGDLVTFEAWAGSGDRAIGFGQLSVKVIPAKKMLAERE